jgi:hypothetical protein
MLSKALSFRDEVVPDGPNDEELFNFVRTVIRAHMKGTEYAV